MELRSRRQIFEARRSPSTRPSSTPTSRTFRSLLDAGSCSSRIVFNVPKAHTIGIEVRVRASAGSRASICRSPAATSTPSSTRRCATPTGDIIAGIRDGNRLPTVPKFQMAATATYGQRFERQCRLVRQRPAGQHVGSRYTQPGDQEHSAGNFGNMIFFDPESGASAMAPIRLDRTLKLPSYDLVNLSAGIDFDSGLERRRSTSTICSTRTPSCRSTASAAGGPASASTSARRGRSA